MKHEVVIYSRPPVAGVTKTRLAVSIGIEAAARVADVLLEHTLTAARVSGAEVRLALSAAPDLAWAAGLGVTWELQPTGGLGERMAGTFAARFRAGARRVVLIGSDCAGLDSGHLEHAFAALAEVPCVLGPAADGGYWLVGQRAPGYDLFSGVTFSVPDTLEQTRRRLRSQGVDWQELVELHDIDTAADLARALADPGIDPALIARLSASLREAGP